jgi:hypothetical protein
MRFRYVLLYYEGQSLFNFTTWYKAKQSKE